MRSLFASVLLLCAFASAQAQQTIYDESRVLYRKEITGGAIIHGDGWGFNFFHAKHKTAVDRRVLGLEMVGMKHPKEIKSFNPFTDASRGYFYGKLNSLLILRPTFGGKHQIADKIRRSGVEVNYVWGIGPSLGFAKPVYLEIGKPDNYPYESIVVERYDPAIHNIQNINGRASWFTGVGDMELYPGAFGRFGLNFEHSNQTSGIKAIEVGASIDAYPVAIPIMAQLEGVVNKQLFFQFYLSVQFGKKFTE